MTVEQGQLTAQTFVGLIQTLGHSATISERSTEGDTATYVEGPRFLPFGAVSLGAALSEVAHRRPANLETRLPRGIDSIR